MFRIGPFLETEKGLVFAILGESRAEGVTEMVMRFILGMMKMF
jgi:hypothetical protein